jgi:hypothetical protein
MSFAVGQRPVDEAPPRTLLFIVDVVDLVAIPAAAVAIGEDQIACGIPEKVGICRAIFVAANHGHALEAVNVERPGSTEVNERDGVHVAAEMDILVAVNGHGEEVVTIPCYL